MGLPAGRLESQRLTKENDPLVENRGDPRAVVQKPDRGPHPRPAGGGGAGDGRRRALQPWSRLLTALRASSSYETIDPNRFWPAATAYLGTKRTPTGRTNTRGGGRAQRHTTKVDKGGCHPGRGRRPRHRWHPSTPGPPPPCVPALWGDSSRAVCPRCPLDTGAKPRHTRRCVPCAEPWPNLTA